MSRNHFPKPQPWQSSTAAGAGAAGVGVAEPGPGAGAAVPGARAAGVGAAEAGAGARAVVADSSGPLLSKATAAANFGPLPESVVVWVTTRASAAAWAAASRHSHSPYMSSKASGSWGMVCDSDMPCGKQRNV